jgi:hypothetical protein
MSTLQRRPASSLAEPAPPPPMPHCGHCRLHPNEIKWPGGPRITPHFFLGPPARGQPPVYGACHSCAIMYTHKSLTGAENVSTEGRGSHQAHYIK